MNRYIDKQKATNEISKKFRKIQVGIKWKN